MELNTEDPRKEVREMLASEADELMDTGPYDKSDRNALAEKIFLQFCCADYLEDRDQVAINAIALANAFAKYANL